MRAALFIALISCTVPSAPPVATDANVGPEHLATTIPTDPTDGQYRLRSACNRLAPQGPNQGYPSVCCSLYCDASAQVWPPAEFDQALEDWGCVRAHECADFVCPLLGGGTLQFGVCVP